MGYTHYFYRPRNVPKKKFQELANDVTMLVDGGELSFGVYGGDGTGPAVINGDLISFNGDEASGLAHETFYLPRVRETESWEHIEKGRIFEFCKTARKPYDLLVTAVLLRVHYRFPSYDISSDGDEEEWGEAVALCNRVFDHEHVLPPRIRSSSIA